MSTIAPAEILALSPILRASPLGAASRAAIGRAYYACYLAGRDSLFGEDGYPPKPQKSRIERLANRSKKSSLASHELVSVALGVHPALKSGTGVRLQAQLEQLKSLRVAADYYRNDLHAIVRSAMANNSVSSWEDLAEVAEVLAQTLLPELERVPLFP